MPALAAIAFLCASPVAVDGDTLRCRGQGLVRLHSIDAPEMPGHCRRGRICTPGDPHASKASLAALVRSGPVTCRAEGRDRYGRMLARCESRRRDLSCEQVRRGQAVIRYSSLRG
jgi:micrococcal nuclease